jgi:hypothetical protein
MTAGFALTTTKATTDTVIARATAMTTTKAATLSAPHATMLASLGSESPKLGTLLSSEHSKNGDLGANGALTNDLSRSVDASVEGPEGRLVRFA